jgi:hypothetical protein
MPDLTIAVVGAEPVAFSATPTIAFKLRVANRGPEEVIYNAALRAQIQIEVTRRSYTAPERQRLRDLFGEPERWGQTLRNLFWTHANAFVPQFNGVTEAELQVPCTFDFSVAATKYFDGLTEGDIPLCFLFSGTVFYAGANGALQVAPVSWDKEAKFRLPLGLWKQMMEVFYPNTAWLCLRRDVFEELNRVKVERGIPTWERTLETMLQMLKQEGVAR